MSPDAAAKARADDFARDGFIVERSFLETAELDAVRAACDALLADRGSAAGDRELGGITRQIMMPSAEQPELRAGPVRARIAALAAELLGHDVTPLFDMIIHKPPGHPHETPWHQDAAYMRTPHAEAGVRIPGGIVQFWLALDDADEENGCMHFVPGAHREPLLEHEVASGEPDDDGRLLALVDPQTQLDLDSAVAAPLPAGGLTAHGYGTPHFTPPNRSSDRDRRAWILSYVRRT